MIVTAPHGGYLDVPNCSYRNFGCYINSQCYFNSTSTCTRDPANCDISTTKDAYTQEIARMVVQNIASLKGKTPHLVIMKCTRYLLNVNICALLNYFECQYVELGWLTNWMTKCEPTHCNWVWSIFLYIINQSIDYCISKCSFNLFFLASWIFWNIIDFGHNTS